MLRELIEEGKNYTNNPVIDMVERPKWINRDLRPFF